MHLRNKAYYQIFSISILFVLLIIVAGVANGASQINYEPHTLNEALYSNAAIVQDYDNDGDLDIIALRTRTDEQPAAIEWLENDGTGQYPRHLLYEDTGTVYSPETFALCDCDADGHRDDYVVADRGGINISGGLVWIQRTDTDIFIPWTIEATGYDDVAVADFNNDGYDDVVGVGFDLTTLNLFLNDGFLNFSKQVVAEEVAQLTEVEAGDIDDDGHVDILYEKALLLNQGDATFQVRHEFSIFTSLLQEMVITDLNNDGIKDIVSFISYGGRGLHFFDGADNFAATEIDDEGIDIGGDLLIADLDGNGWKDVIRQQYAKDTITVLYQNEELVFDRVVIERNWDSRGPSEMALGDLDGDNDLDLVFPENGNIDGDFSWFENINGEFYRHQLYMELRGANMVQVADLDQDGDEDIVVVVGEDIVPENELIWFENKGDNHFIEWRIDDQLEDATDVKAGDINGDGKLDLVALANGGNKIFWYHKNGLNWEKKVIEANGNNPFFGTLADIDSDGDLDLAATHFGDDKVFWYVNDGTGNFTRRVVDPLLYSPRKIDAADIDKDGDIDLVTASPDKRNSVVVYWNNGSQQFTRQILQADFIGADVKIADWNGDGLVDIVASYGGNPDNTTDIGLFLSQGNGAFSYSTLIDAYGSTSSLIIADLDQDSDLDIVLGKISPVEVPHCFFPPRCLEISPLQIRLNENGALTTKMDLLDPQSEEILGLDLGDINGDGHVDIFAAETFSRRITYFLTSDSSPSPTPLPPSTPVGDYRFYIPATSK